MMALAFGISIMISSYSSKQTRTSLVKDQGLEENADEDANEIVVQDADENADEDAEEDVEMKKSLQSPYERSRRQNVHSHWCHSIAALGVLGPRQVPIQSVGRKHRLLYILLRRR